MCVFHSASINKVWQPDLNSIKLQMLWSKNGKNYSTYEGGLRKHIPDKMEKETFSLSISMVQYVRIAVQNNQKLTK